MITRGIEADYQGVRIRSCGIIYTICYCLIPEKRYSSIGTNLRVALSQLLGVYFLPAVAVRKVSETDKRIALQPEALYSVIVLQISG